MIYKINYTFIYNNFVCLSLDKFVCVKVFQKWGNSMRVRILLSIEYNIYRKCLKGALEKYDSISITEEACFLDDLGEDMSDKKYDIIVTDMHTRNMLYTEVINKIMSCNEIGVIALLPSDNINELNGIPIEQFDGVVMLSSEIDKLVRAIHIVNNNGRYIDDCFEQKYQVNEDDKASILTNRELEVLKLIAKGCFNKEIASKMGITERTVKNHVSNIFKKIDVCDRTQAAIYAIRNNIVIL